MKFKFDIECTPEEARTFIGLPDVAPMQERLMEELEKRLQESISTLTPEEVVRTWMPATVQGLGEMQKMFWAQMGMSGVGPSAQNKSQDDQPDE